MSKTVHMHPAGRPHGREWGGRTFCGRIATGPDRLFRIAQKPEDVTCKQCRDKMHVGVPDA